MSVIRLSLLYVRRLCICCSGLPLSGRTAYITPWDCHRTSKLNFKDVRNFFCPSDIDTRDVQKLSKGPPTLNQLYDVCPAYLPEIRYLCWLSYKDVPLSACGSFIDSRVKCRGTLLMAAWSLRVFVARAELINWCFYNYIFYCNPEYIRWNYMKSLLFFNIHVLKS